MAESGAAKDLGPALMRLYKITREDYRWDPFKPEAELLFGENWILPFAFREALDSGKTIGALEDILDDLLQKPFQNLYEDSQVQKQGTDLAHGVIHATRAACRFALHSEDEQVSELLRESAASLDRAWPCDFLYVPDRLEQQDEVFLRFAADLALTDLNAIQWIRT